jgi:SnoaL-like polyketide cyclase
VPDGNEELVKRFYHELWNRWDLGVAGEILAEDVRFRGTLGSTLEGREAFKGYVETVRRAFPDWRNRIDEAISCGDRVVTRMTWSGTHEGELSGVEPTGARVEYVGARRACVHQPLCGVEHDVVEPKPQRAAQGEGGQGPPRREPLAADKNHGAERGAAHEQPRQRERAGGQVLPGGPNAYERRGPEDHRHQRSAAREQDLPAVHALAGYFIGQGTSRSPVCWVLACHRSSVTGRLGVSFCQSTSMPSLVHSAAQSFRLSLEQGYADVRRGPHSTLKPSLCWRRSSRRVGGTQAKVPSRRVRKPIFRRDALAHRAFRAGSRRQSRPHPRYPTSPA